jgi:hypothetical protein
MEKGLAGWSRSITQELNSNFDHLARSMLGLELGHLRLIVHFCSTNPGNDGMQDCESISKRQKEKYHEVWVRASLS